MSCGGFGARGADLRVMRLKLKLQSDEVGILRQDFAWQFEQRQSSTKKRRVTSINKHFTEMASSTARHQDDQERK